MAIDKKPKDNVLQMQPKKLVGQLSFGLNAELETLTDGEDINDARVFVEQMLEAEIPPRGFIIIAISKGGSWNRAVAGSVNTGDLAFAGSVLLREATDSGGDEE